MFHTVNKLGCIFLFFSLFFFSCRDKNKEIPEPISAQPSTGVKKVDGRSVKLSDTIPIALDVQLDGKVDFTIFIELTANSLGDRLYVGINPIGNNKIKSEPENDENFLSMGLLIAEAPQSLINEKLENNQRWTSDFGAFVIRNTFSSGQIFYEGAWQNPNQVVAIQLYRDGNFYFGWLKLDFNRVTEVVTLIEYGYETTPNKPIKL